MMVIICLPIITWIGYAGISISVRTIVVVGALEFLIVLGLGLWGLFDPGPGGFTFSVFSPSYDPGEHHRRAPASCSRSCSPCRG